MIFLKKCFSIITDGITVGKSLGNSVGNKKIITDVSVPSVIELATDLPTDKTLPTNDSPTDHFRL